MNINILADNPPWWYYFVVLTPVTLAIALGFYLMKRHSSFSQDPATNISPRENSPFNDPRRRLLTAAQYGHTREVIRIIGKTKRGSRERMEFIDEALNQARFEGHGDLVNQMLWWKKKEGDASMLGSFSHTVMTSGLMAIAMPAQAESLPMELEMMESEDSRTRRRRFGNFF